MHRSIEQRKPNIKKLVTEKSVTSFLIKDYKLFTTSKHLAHTVACSSSSPTVSL